MRAFFDRQPTDGSSFFLLKERAKPIFELCFHYHEEYELTLILRGSGRRFVGDDIGQFAEGDLVLMGPGLPHAWCSYPGARASFKAMSLRFRDDVFGPWRSDPLKLGPVGRMLDRCARGIRFGGAGQRDVVARMLALGGVSPVRQLGELFVILDVLARRADETILSGRHFVAGDGPPARHPLENVCKLIEARQGNDVSLEDAAGMLAMSRSAFRDLFYRTKGKTFSAYVNELRVERASQLLKETRRTIAEVAGTSGFQSVSSFSRCFRHAKRMSPGAYRLSLQRSAARSHP